MKIAFPLLNKTELADDFAHANFIAIYESKTDKLEIVPLSGLEKGVGASTFFGNLIGRGLNSVACSFYSYMTLRVFKENNVETLKSISTELIENINAYNINSLPQFDVYEALLTGPCASDCGSCGTTCTTEPEY